MKSYNKYAAILLSYINSVVFYSKSKLTHRQFIFLSAIIIGVSVGFSSILLKQLLHSIFNLINDNQLFNSTIFYVTLPVIGILTTVIISSYFFRNKKMFKGLSGLLYIIHKRGGLVPRIHMYIQIITSSFTVGFGGSAGVEAPIVVTGAAYGSNYARRHRMSKKDRVLLLAAGVAAGIGSAFNAPIAGVLFTLEVLTLDVTVTAFIPLIIAAASGAIISKVFLGDGVILEFYHQKPFDYSNTFFYLFLAMICGLFSVYHNRVFHYIEDKAAKYKINRYQKAIFGSLLLSILILFFPSLFGEGYASIKWLSTGNEFKLLNNSIVGNYFHSDWFIVLFVTMVLLFKPVATAITLGSGGNGGNFAPSLFVGAFVGFIVSRLLNLIFNFDIPESNFVLVGMAGILSGLYHAPLTAIFLIAEITGGYELILPLMLVASLSYAISKYFETHSLDTKIFAETGNIISANKDEQVLSDISIDDIIDTDYYALNQEMLFSDFLSLFKQQHFTIYPVLDSFGEFKGVITIDSIKDIIFQKEGHTRIKIKDILLQPAEIVTESITIEHILDFMDEYDYWFAPVVIKNQFKGFIYKNSILTNYRNRLKNDIID
jgi:CIC family chloride channel protein